MDNNSKLKYKLTHFWILPLLDKLAMVWLAVILAVGLSCAALVVFGILVYAVIVIFTNRDVAIFFGIVVGGLMTIVAYRRVMDR